MNFIDSYKKLEKLCSEIYGDNHGISLYIDEMTNTPQGSRYVNNWHEDLKQLKHYRWVRNQIVHEPGCTEANMCKSGDIQWINSFYSRVMSAKDPLALYRKATRKNGKKYSVAEAKKTSRQHTYPQQRKKRRKNKSSHGSTGCGTLILLAVIVMIAIFLLLKLIYKIS